MDDDISICYHDKSIYCCHTGDDDHDLSDRDQEECGKYKSCYLIIEEKDNYDCLN